LDADNAWTDDSDPEWYVACATKPDNVADNLSGWSKLTDAGDDQDGSLNNDEWSYDTGNNRVYVQLSDASDPNDTDMRLHYAWDGSGDGPAIMTETIEDAIYLIHLNFEIGDASTSTTLTSQNEHVYFDDAKTAQVKTFATLYIGDVINSGGISGGFWSFSPSATMHLVNSGTLYVCASHIHNRAGTKQIQFSNGNVYFYDSIFSSTDKSPMKSRYCFSNNLSYMDVSRCYFNFLDKGALLQITPDVWADNRIHYAGMGYYAETSEPTITGGKLTDIDNQDIYIAGYGGASSCTIIDPEVAISSVHINEADKWIKEQYTCNITVADKDGTLLDGVEVLCEDKDDAQVFTTTTGDTDTGKIDEQTITYKTWTGTSETLVTSSPHKFTISKAGYETLILENITVDAPIVWHLELKGPVRHKLGSDTFFTDDS